MELIDQISALRARRRAWQQNQKVIGFVPTMGNLHDGHLKLVKSAKKACDIVVVSIFVNPMQFGPNEDLDNYPRTQDEDCKKLESLGTDVVFLPSATDIYPRGLEQQTFVEVPGISSMVCGASRPGHFRGVATIVCKLFNMVQPNKAFFGEKDFQQVQVIKAMVADLSMNLEIIGVPTERHHDGLAMSSRNGYLSAAEREIAPRLYALLSELKASVLAGAQNFVALSSETAEKLNEAGFRTDYVEIRQAATLQPAGPADTELVILIAAFLGKTRLIDNVTVTVSS